MAAASQKAKHKPAENARSSWNGRFFASGGACLQITISAHSA